jgi:hypothetical protein
MNTCRDRLISDLWPGPEAGAQREATLQAGRRALRVRRLRRLAFRTSAVVALVAAIGFGLIRRAEREARPIASAPVSPAPVRHLTDDQLLGLFPGTAVGLARVGDREVLVFPKVGDQERFVGRF